MNKKLNKATYIFYGLGVGYFMLDQIFNQWVQYFYLPSSTTIEKYGIRPIIPVSMLVVAFLIMRLVDAFTDPLVGYLSDNSKSRLGRRSTYMLLGLLPLVFSTILFFFPISNSVLISTIYLSVVGSVYFTGYTLVGGPYNALLADLSSSKSERLTLSTIQSVFRLIFTAIPLIFSSLVLDVLIKKGYSFDAAMRIMVTIFSIISGILVLVSIIGIKENKNANRVENQEHIKFSTSISYLKNKEILLYFIGFFFFFSGFNIIRNSIIYYVTGILGQPEKASMIPTALLFLVSAIFFPITKKLCEKYEYRQVMLLDLLLIFVGVVLLILLGEKNIYIFYFSFVVIGMGVSGSAFIFPPAMLSEISNKIYEKDKLRIEGMMFGIQGLFLKLAMLIQIVTTTLLLTLGTVNGGATKYGILATLFVALIFLVISFICYYLKKSEI